MIDSGSDHIGLGGWSWYLVEGEPGHRTYVITAYVPYGNIGVVDHTVYKQQERYIPGERLRNKSESVILRGTPSRTLKVASKRR